MLESATSETFAPHVGTRFEVVNDQSLDIVLELTDCSETPYGKPDEWAEVTDRVPFSLEFHHEGGEPVLAQQIVQLRHEVLGEFALFIVPIGPSPTGMRYEAVIG